MTNLETKNYFPRKRDYSFECLRACNNQYGKFAGFATGNSKEEIRDSLEGTGLKPFGKVLILKIRLEDNNVNGGMI